MNLPEDWPYSNYLEWIGQRKEILYDQDFVEENFPYKDEYITLVNEFIETQHLPKDVSIYVIQFE